MIDDQPLVPQWNQATVADIIPAILEPRDDDTILPDSVVDARSVVVLVLDGLGWEQLQDRTKIAPTLTSMQGQAISTVAPSTTAAALTSIVTGTPPGVHGVVGYRIDVEGEVLNMLSWRTRHGDARERIVPEDFQTTPAFLGHRPVVVQNAPFVRTGFTRAHLSETRQQAWRTLPTLPVEVRRAVAAGEPFVYAYYDGIDKIAHEFGFGEHYDAELAACDRLVADLMMALPRGTAIVVTADHGLVDCANGERQLESALYSLINRTSGEGRFRWLHAEPGRASELLDAACDAHSEHAWIRSLDQILDEQWFGPTVTDIARRRLGDVAIVARDNWTFMDRVEGAGKPLIGRHGSLTSTEMLVPLVTFCS